MLLTQKTDNIFTSDHLGEFDKRNLCLAEWRRVQALVSLFWSRWRKEYLPLLQRRRKWTEDRRDLIEGDVILLKDKNICRTQWPVGIIVNSFKSSDEHVRKAEVRVIVNGKATTYNCKWMPRQNYSCGYCDKSPLSFIRRNVGSCPKEVKKQAYLALVRPHLEYARRATNTMSWDKQINKVMKVFIKRNRALGFIRRNVGSCPEEVKKQAYLALVRPHLE
ncbi:Hypothetical predicted protein [Mytilus galloprovincialis]|uniref:DUF5641 domain-containing protein n=1 Tax=Mytilus galloprovincialis TaxID=29158 RepID=A0A8B6BJF9_MYTGA|nr:Hypothetical predicted protein [Mytilus galloprovincialis]